MEKLKPHDGEWQAQDRGPKSPASQIHAPPPLLHYTSLPGSPLFPPLNTCVRSDPSIVAVSSFFTLKFLGQVILFPLPRGKEFVKYVALSSKRGAAGKSSHPPPRFLPLACPTISHLVLQPKPNMSLHERRNLCWCFLS